MLDDQGARFVTERLDTVRPESFVLQLFGGEPLLNIPVIYDQAQRALAACQKRGVTLALGIITNGLLLTPDVVDRLLPYGLSGVKITLDGDRDTHDRIRRVTGGFDRRRTAYINWNNLMLEGGGNASMFWLLVGIDPSNTNTGRYDLLTGDSPGDVVKWVLDRNNVPRVAVSVPEPVKDAVPAAESTLPPVTLPDTFISDMPSPVKAFLNSLPRPPAPSSPWPWASTGPSGPSAGSGATAGASRWPAGRCSWWWACCS